MPRSEKWIKAKPEQSVTKVARQALQTRFKQVWRYAKLAAKQPYEDIEYVHSLRVSARRAETALQVFHDLLPPKKARRIRKMLKHLRRAGGEARDLDVLADRLAEFTDHRKKRNGVVKQVRRSRRVVQKGLVKDYRLAKRKDFPSKAKRLAKSAEWKDPEDEPCFAEAAHDSLTPIADEFFAAGEADLSDISALHNLRIRGKRLRYAMELLESAFDRSFRDEVYPIFCDVQDRLGAINDHATAIRLITAWCNEGDTGRSEIAAQILANEEAQLVETCDAFRHWWTPQRASELRARLEGRAVKDSAPRSMENLPAEAQS